MAALVGSVGLAIGLGWWKATEFVQLRAELRLARADFDARRYQDSSSRFARLAARWPGRADLEYWLGASEMMAGQPDAALEAWGRVPDGYSETPLAALSRGRLALEIGRYGLAESSLEHASVQGGSTSTEARRLLGRLYWMTGRRDEYQRLLRKEVSSQLDPSETLRLLWSLDNDPDPIAGIAQMLEKAKDVAPDDDRVWLALADLAIRRGRVQEADSWLTRCEEARPTDLAVWRVRLNWAIAADRPEEVPRAAVHIPDSGISRENILAIRAYLCGKHGDRVGQRVALEELVILAPGDTSALERLIDLVTRYSDSERVAKLRKHKAEIDSWRARYRTLINLPELIPHAAELARAASVIGRRFDARAWWGLAKRRDPSLKNEAEAALKILVEPPLTPAAKSDQTLADVLGPYEPKLTAGHSTPDLSSSAQFHDEAQSRGLIFRFDNGQSTLHQLPETMSGGVGLLDFDGDGWLDVYAVQGGPFPPPNGAMKFGDRLFRNRGNGRFEDATASSGLAKLPGGYGFGVAVGDYDNDGRPDLFITRWRSYALYHNLGQGRFEDATLGAGLSGDRDWPTSAAWADLDDDGDLDLYVCHYLRWDAADPTKCLRPRTTELTYCDPRYFPALPDHVFRNDQGRFVDVTEKAGVVDHDGRGLGVLAADLDDDGRTDLFVANDTTANFFFRNEGGFRFREQALESGLASSATGGYLAGMGVATADFDGDGRIDLAVTNFFGESTTLYHNHGGGLFTDRSAATGLALATRSVLGFGLAALDADNDGRPDLVQANGHVSDLRPSTPYAMPAQIFFGRDTSKLIDMSIYCGPPWAKPRVGRGLAVGDLDNDGRIDVVIVAQDCPLVLLHNAPSNPGRGDSGISDYFITIALEGTRTNRDAVGARVVVTAGGRTQTIVRSGGGSYLSSSDPRMHIGLKTTRRVDRIEIFWPSGRRDVHEDLGADRGYRIREGDRAPGPLVGFSSPALKSWSRSNRAGSR